MPKAHVQESRNRRKAKRKAKDVTAVGIQVAIKRWERGGMLQRMQAMKP